jgi:hypothetical protein
VDIDGRLRRGSTTNISPARLTSTIGSGAASTIAARESNLHGLAETITWLDTYVKNAPARRQTDSASR